MRVVRVALAGAVFGLLSRLSWALPSGFDWTHRAAWPWALAAFVVGALATARRDAARDGALLLVVAVLAYYALMAFVEHRYGDTPIGVVWVLAAAPAGALFGVVGVTWRSAELPERALISTLVLALVATEAVYSSGVVGDLLKDVRGVAADVKALIDLFHDAGSHGGD